MLQPALAVISACNPAHASQHRRPTAAGITVGESNRIHLTLQVKTILAIPNDVESVKILEKNLGATAHVNAPPIITISRYQPRGGRPPAALARPAAQ